MRCCVSVQCSVDVTGTLARCRCLNQWYDGYVKCFTKLVGVACRGSHRVSHVWAVTGNVGPWHLSICPRCREHATVLALELAQELSMYES